MVKVGMSILNRIIHFITKLILLIAIIAIPILVLRYGFKINDIKISGSSLYTKDDIIDSLIKTESDKSTLIFYMKYKYFSKPKLPFIEKMDIELSSYNSLDLYLYDKVIIGCIEYMGEYMYFDKDGIIIESSTELYNDIPLIKGLQFNKIILNEELTVQRRELFGIILNLTQQIRFNKIKVDMITFNSKNEVKLTCKNIKVLLGKEDTYDEKLQELASILEEVEGKSLTIDMKNINLIRATEE